MHYEEFKEGVTLVDNWPSSPKVTSRGPDIITVKPQLLMRTLIGFR